jgi:hypothetical protein
MVTLASPEPLFTRSILIKLDANVMVYCQSEALLTTQVLFGGLYAKVAK